MVEVEDGRLFMYGKDEGSGIGLGQGDEWPG